MKRTGIRPAAVVALFASVAGLLAAGPEAAEAQGLTFSQGQSVSPAFEGWTRNDDGSFNLMFGYMNRNWEEEPDVPVGPNNYFSPGPEDRGQPTHFLPRRNRFVFEVRVPADFGDEELRWTVNVNGEEQTAYGTLRDDYFVDNVVIMSETGTLGAGTSNPELRAHAAPEVDLETASEIEAVVGRPLRLVAHVSDDGLPRRDRRSLPVDEEGNLDLARALRAPPSRITVDKIIGLNMSWFVYRAPEGVEAQNVVEFDPPQVATWEDTRPFSNSPWAPFWVPPELPEDGRWIAEVTFTEPGTYVLRGRADDGGLFTDRDVTVTVRPPAL
jgi:hypothetical protein